METLVEFANNNLLLVTGLLAAGLAATFYELRLKARNIASLSIPLAVRMINQGGRVIDVRQAEKFASGHIVDARNIDRETLLKSPEQIKKKNTVLVCDTGADSGECVAQLRKKGMENVFSLRGGLEEWRKENLPLVGTD
jgi:rhodanese-related sulfurtransferase